MAARCVLKDTRRMDILEESLAEIFSRIDVATKIETQTPDDVIIIQYHGMACPSV